MPIPQLKRRIRRPAIKKAAQQPNKRKVTPVMPVAGAGGAKSGVPARNGRGIPRKRSQRQGAPAKGKVAKNRKNTPVKAKKKVVDPLLARARATVASELNPQIGELRRQMEENRTVGTQSIADTQSLFGLAGQANEQNRVAADQTYDDTQAKIAKLYQDAATDVDTNYANAQLAADSEQHRLGIDIPDTNVARDRGYFTGLTNLMGASAQGTLLTEGANNDAMFRRLASGIAADSAGRQTDIAQGMNALGRELSAQAGILSASRKSKVLAILGELQDKQAASQAEAQQQQFLNEIAARKLGISERQLQANIAKMRGDQRIAAAKVELTRKKNESDAAYKARMARIAANNSSIKAQQAAIQAENAKVERDLKRSQTMENITDAQTKQNKPGSGYDAARAYIAKNTKGMPGQSRVANNIKAILTIYTPSMAAQYEARGESLWGAIRRSKYYQSLPPSAKGMVVQAYQIAYGKID